MERAIWIPERQLSLAFAAACAALVGMASCGRASEPSPSPTQQSANREGSVARHPYIGMWMTDDGRVRHQLLPGGRYDEARGDRESAYRGRYEVSGNHIEYWDDTGFTADGDFVDANTLHHGGMILRRRPPSSSERTPRQ